MSRLCAVVVVIIYFFVRIFLLFSCSERKVLMTEIQRLCNRIGLVRTGDLESPDVDLRVSFGESSVVLGRGSGECESGTRTKKVRLISYISRHPALVCL